jgi:hypothetical protein
MKIIFLFPVHFFRWPPLAARNFRAYTSVSASLRFIKQGNYFIKLR